MRNPFRKLFISILRRHSHPRLPHRPRWFWRRLPFPRALALSLALLPFLGACDKAEFPQPVIDKCRELRVCSMPDPPPLLIDLAGDPSQGAPFSKDSLAESTTLAAAYLAERPNSHLRLWLVGATVGTTRMVADVVVPPLHGKGKKARTDSIQRFVGSTRELFLSAAQPAFASKPPRQSPLVEALAKIALADSHGLTRRLVLISDARQVSSDTADFECGKRLPSETEWLKLIKRVVPQGSLSRVSLAFSYVTASPSGRCPVSVEREVAIRQLWQAMAKHAAAKEILFTSGAAAFTDEPQTALARKE